MSWMAGGGAGSAGEGLTVRVQGLWCMHGVEPHGLVMQGAGFVVHAGGVEPHGLVMQWFRV